MNVLALWGKGSKGKTTTINLLTGLLSNGFTQNINFQYPVTLPINMGKDNCYIVIYNGKKIGITTRGDTKKALEDDFRWLKQNAGDCDLYVCATRSKGTTCKYIEQEAATSDIFWIAKASVTHKENGTYVDSAFITQRQGVINQKQADYIRNFIDKMITNHII